MKKIVLSILSILAIILTLLTIALMAVFVRYCIIGKVLPIHTLYNRNIQVTDSKIVIEGDMHASAWVFKNYKYKIENNEMYIKVSYVFTSLFYSGAEFDIAMKGEFKDLKRIYYADDNEKELIWDKLTN